MKNGKKPFVSQYDLHCPELETLDKYKKGTADLLEMQDVHEHLECCNVCSNIVVESLKSDARRLTVVK
jgi:hypothetical protein